MESESTNEMRALRDVAAIRAKRTRVPRGHASLQLAFAILLSAYMGVFVFTGSVEGGASASGGTTMTLLLPPLVVASALVSGANERFRERMRTNTRHWIAFGVFVGMLAIFIVWGIMGGGYPWWIALVVVGITLLLFGIRPLGVILRSSTLQSTSSRNEERAGLPRALAAPVRVTTALLGVFFGVVCVVVFVPAIAWFVMMLAMLVALIAVSARTASWGLLRTGYEWRVPQWAGFAVAVSVMFALAVLIVIGDVVTPFVTAGAGVLAAAPLIVSAFLPGRSRGAS